MRFFIRIFVCPYPHKPDSLILNKSFPKKIFCKGVQLYFEISLLYFIQKIFKQNFYLYTTVYLVRIWTNKNADEKAHTFSRSKNVKKRTKTYEKRILCKFTFIFENCYFRIIIQNLTKCNILRTFVSKIMQNLPTSIFSRNYMSSVLGLGLGFF